MEKDRRDKIIAIVALFVGIFGLTLGFASFSNLVTISSKAVVSPNDSSFNVELSSVEDEVRDGTVAAKTGNGSDATIVNGTSPTIARLTANFTKPGESVTYEFYAINTGDLDAILNKVEFTVISGTNKKSCVATGTGDAVADETMLANACNDIRVTVTVENEDRACDTSTYGNHPLNVDASEKITVVIEYATDGTRVDGPFRVDFGDIKLNYSTVQDGAKNISTCSDIVIEPPSPLLIGSRTNVIDNDEEGTPGYGVISLGDMVTLGTERFYVISTDETTNEVRLLTEYKLNLDTGSQDPTCTGTNCGIKFSDDAYWSASGGNSYLKFSYNESSNLYPYVQAYQTKVRDLGYTNVTASLITYNDAYETFNCTSSNNSCKENYNWFYNVGSYWTGSSYSDTLMLLVHMDGGVDSYGHTYASSGIRPVITIPAVDI